ncbi:AFR090Wp [Eremothecium gossypii ATCC 10895]|uniref:Very-long-chain (3R)-3-hydroxyacyl-CoA dehydratase n=1 Tax=Eremothecium gossypii (strain ATCC 10895 / CBS 109.51 / FGSC 9923 / NRRL Y-1056) TaxID=284811 RepID=Q754Y4_EREGS|nr:AFR090Wp [Eremothecium gossypii ATCC 10895]AAS53461.1 AFR090Wp [Eremothecium gossypii ATCC 10895]AEY97773.1 FAFR090Wp [Eremothecium gossypii FDAG1]
MATKTSFGTLALYNLFSALSWAYVLANVALVYPRIGQPRFYAATRGLVTVVQCGMLIEVFNAATGIVKTPVSTTVAQVLSRVLVVVCIFRYIPEAPNASDWPYITLLLAWSITEIVRYSYYFCNLVRSAGTPKWLTILRYNLFWVLYPLGVMSELLIIYSALPHAEARYGAWARLALVAAMLVYIPGFPMLYLHVIAQRRKVMKALRSTAAGAKKTT